MISSNFWSKKKVFITGHNGFKGSWLTLYLKYLGADVKGYSLKPNSKLNLLKELNLSKDISSEIGDIRNYKKLKKTIIDYNPDIIFHLAAQPIVSKSYQDPKNTFSINTIGVVNLFEAVRSCKSVKALINVTSDKCYEIIADKRGYKETDPMGGFDPYSCSKGCSELITSSYKRSFFSQGLGIASVRAGNVIGGGDWAVDRLLPDVFRSLKKKIPIIVRNPEYVRPWQHVLEPIDGYICLAEKLFKNPRTYSGSWNFGPEKKSHKTVREILLIVKSHLPNLNIEFNSSKYDFHESRYLALNINKAKKILKWQPRWDIKNSIQNTVDWYKNYNNNMNMNKYSTNQIMNYINHKI